MRSFRIVFNQRAASVFAATALVFATLIPSFAAAATVTDRSIELSSSVKSAEDVTYTVKFTAQTAGTGAFVVDFCDSPTIDTTCNAPAGFDASNVSTSGDDTVTDLAANTVKVVLDQAVGVGGAVEVELTTVDSNPSATGVFYARIVTYTDGTPSDPGPGNFGYVSATDLDDDGAAPYLDTGSVAMSITDGFTVGGRALETLTFCVSGTDTITTGCTGTLGSPNLELGVGGVLATTASTGTVYTQISTNAATGAIVNLKSNTSGCGGLVRQGSATNAAGCGITPLTVGAATIADSAAKFGLKLAGLGGGSGTTTAVVGSSYDTDNFLLNWETDDSAGVTSVYGDPVYNTNGAPVSDGTADLIFGANISPITPAGTYSASLNLIATGKF